MISTGSANVSSNLSNVQSADNTSRRTQDASYVKLPVPAIDFQQQLVRVAQPVDEVTIDATAQTGSGALDAQKSRVELRSNQSPLPRVSRPVSQPPIAEAAPPFPSIDVTSEPNLNRAASTRPIPLEQNAAQNDSDTTDQFQLSNEAKVAEFSERDSLQRVADSREEKLQRIEKQAADRLDRIVSEQDGQAGQQPFNRLV